MHRLRRGVGGGRLPHQPSIAAAQRRRAGHLAEERARRDLRSGTTLVRELLGDPDQSGPAYVLSAFWVEEPIWDGADLVTAMRLMCVPSVLLDRRLVDDEILSAKAEVAERAHLRNGFSHPEIAEFGVSGVSIGCAS